MAIPMPIVQDIRRLDRQGMSRAQIARRLHVDRGTVAKYADMEDCSPKPKADRRYGSKIDPYAHLVDGWLEADRMLPRKQRHTIRRVHDRLLAETDYDGEYSTTMRYVHRWREANRGVPDREGYVRLEWAAGSMQVDFGVARARIAGEMADVHCLVVSLPYSNMRLCVALPGENAECLCHGLMLVFEHIGGVPPVIVMDNATGAGRRNAKGEVALTGVFSAFVAHYRLEVRFCNPYSGNEKGSVENAVGFLRRNLMVPPMRAESYGQLSRLLLERCDGLARDSYCPRLPDVPVAEVFDEERAALMPLPSTAFDPVRWESRTADKYGLVDIDSNRYLAGPDSARSRVLAAIRWDTVTLASPATGELLAEYPRQYGRSRNVEDPALVLPRLAVKPRAWRESSIRPDVPDDIRAWLDSMDEKTLRESLKAIGDACRAAGFDPAMQACGEILRSNRDMGLHADSLTPIALRMRDGEWEYPGGIEDCISSSRCFVFSHVFFFGFRQLHAFSLFFRLRGGVPAEHEGLTDAAALAGELEEPPVVHDAVDDRCGEFVVREDRAPFTELDVRGEYDAPSFVAARDDLVEQARPVDVEGYVAELVQYDQVGTADVPEHRLERAVAFGLAQLEDELGGLMEPHAQPHVDRLHAQPDREMCLSAPGLAVEHQVLRARDETEP